MHKHEVVEFLAVLVIMEHVQTFIAVEARVFRISFAAGCHPSSGKRVTRATAHTMCAQVAVEDGITRAIEAIVRGKQPNVVEDEHVLAIALMKIDVRLS